jgi:hypothetical protein
MDLTIRALTNSRVDRSITADVIRQNHAETDAGRWVSRLWPKEALDPVRSHDSATRRIHQQLTLPWTDNSKRILPSSKFDKYMAEMRQRKPERQALLDTFFNQYSHWIDEARKMRGDAFDHNDYPDIFTARQAFDFEVVAEPVPHAGDFRITLSKPDREDVEAGLQSRLEAAATVARNELLARVTKPLVALVEKLSTEDPNFRDSIIGNVRAVADEIPDFNITDDADIEILRKRILAELAGLDPDVLRESKSDRSRATRKANDILATMAPWLDPVDQAA